MGRRVRGKVENGCWGELTKKQAVVGSVQLSPIDESAEVDCGSL